MRNCTKIRGVHDEQLHSKTHCKAISSRSSTDVFCTLYCPFILSFVSIYSHTIFVKKKKKEKKYKKETTNINNQIYRLIYHACLTNGVRQNIINESKMDKWSKWYCCRRARANTRSRSDVKALSTFYGCWICCAHRESVWFGFFSTGAIMNE